MRQLLRNTCTNSLPNYFHYQQRKIAAKLELRDLSYPSEILLGQEYRYADRVRETVRLDWRKNLQLEERELRHLYPSNKCSKGRELGVGPKVFGLRIHWKRILKLYRAIDNQPRSHMV